jgi:hypothetical protein
MGWLWNYLHRRKLRRAARCPASTGPRLRRALEPGLVPSGVAFHWPDADREGRWNIGANWWSESAKTSGSVPGPGVSVKFGVGGGTNGDDPQAPCPPADAESRRAGQANQPE